jgi:hypothetical protein
MAFEYRPAERGAAIPLIGIYGRSGTGKTFSSLLLARGLVGPKGKIGVIDTEQGRGALYADQIPGGYEIGQLDKFHPKDYIDAIDAFEKAGMNCIIIDSGSHEWEGIGGVRDMAALSEANKGPGIHNWIKPKQEHSKFMQRILRSKVPIIICLRAKYRTVQGKDKNGKTTIIRDEHTTPTQDSDFIFEMTAHMEILDDHSVRLTKWSLPELQGCFPTNGPITVETGEKVMACLSGTTPSEAPEPVSGDDGPTDMVDEAYKAAGEGTAALETWWKAAGAETQHALKNSLQEMKEAAARVDADKENA